LSQVKKILDDLYHCPEDPGQYDAVEENTADTRPEEAKRFFSFSGVTDGNKLRIGQHAGFSPSRGENHKNRRMNPRPWQPGPVPGQSFTRSDGAYGKRGIRRICRGYN
jgi:hypothetical protein